MKTQYYTASSLDGFIATEDHSLEWLLRHLEPDASTGQIAWPYTQPAFVFTSRQLPSIDDADIRIVQGDVRPVHQAMQPSSLGKTCVPTFLIYMV